MYLFILNAHNYFPKCQDPPNIPETHFRSTKNLRTETLQTETAFGTKYVRAHASPPHIGQCAQEISASFTKLAPWYQNIQKLTHKLEENTGEVNRPGMPDAPRDVRCAQSSIVRHHLLRQARSDVTRAPETMDREGNGMRIT